MNPDEPFPYVLQMTLQAPGTGEIAQIITILFLLVSSAIISAAEVAYFSLSPIDHEKLEENPTPTHQRVLKIFQNPQWLLATVLLCNNSINISIIILSTSVMNELFVFAPEQELIKFLVEIVAVTFMLLLFCEVIPKVYARQNALKVASFMSGPLVVLEKIFHPFVWLLMKTGARFYNRNSGNQNSITVNELEHALEITFGNEPANEEKKILEGIVKFGNTSVKQIMCPRTEMIAVEENISFKQLLEEINEHGYSRIPVYHGNLDTVRGVLFVKDLLPFIDNDQKPNWSKLVREPFYVPENRKIDDLLMDFKSTRNHMAIVVDEYGGTVGLVTLEDVLEEIVGDITDEFDDDEIAYTRIDENNYVFEGKTKLIDFYKVLKIDGDEFERAKGESDTLAGFILEVAGRLPAQGSVISFEKYSFTIEAADNKRIIQIKITKGNAIDDLGNMLNPKLMIAGLVLCASLLGCGNNSDMPRPRGYMRIELPEHTYKSYNGECPYEMEISTASDVVPAKSTAEGMCFGNLQYGRYKATMYLTYVNPSDSLGSLLEDCHSLAYKHDIKASHIEPEAVLHPESRVFGLIYHIKGNAASTLQFYVTDSTHHFLRGALYFYARPNFDSIKPVLDFIAKDLTYSLKTLHWKDKTE